MSLLLKQLRDTKIAKRTFSSYPIKSVLREMKEKQSWFEALKLLPFPVWIEPESSGLLL